MSNAIVPMRSVLVNEPRLEISEPKTYVVSRGGKDVTYKPIVSNNFSTDNIAFTAPPPNQNVVVDRLVWIQTFVRFTFTGVGPQGPPVQLLLADSAIPEFTKNGKFAQAPRAFPISSCVSTLSVKLNNTTVNINMSDVIQPLLHYYNNDTLRSTSYNLTPSMLDQFQSYNEGNGSARNPLAGYANVSSANDMPRGGFPKLVGIDQQAGTAVVDAVFTEPIFLSPFLFSGKDKVDESQGFIQVDTMDFNFTMGNLSRMWSSAVGDAKDTSSISSIAVSFTHPPRLLFAYVSPNDITSIPATPIYPYFSVQRYPTNMPTALASNTLTTVESSNIQLNSIPRMLYLFARDSNSTQDFKTSDTFMGIESVSVNWNNRSGLLSSASPEDLYTISVQNGYSGSYTQWAKHQGAVLCLRLGRDIPLGSAECPGLLGNYQLQLSCNVRNLRSTPISPTFYIVVVSEGSITMVNGSTSVTQIGIVTPQNVLDAKPDDTLSYNKVEKIYGGDFFSGLKNFVSDAVSGISKGIDVATKAIPVIEKVAPLLPLIGLGDEGTQYLGGQKKRGRPRKAGGIRVGGKMMSRAQLANRMM